MTDKERAAQNLETIRSMMERATVYRMISGPTALFAGVLVIVTAIYAPTDFWDWRSTWFCVAGLVMAFNTILVLQKAKKEKTPIFSSGLRMGIRSLFPAMLVGAVIGFFDPRGYSTLMLSWIWMLCYGVALMSTVSFAPRSLWVLGAAFLVSGLYCFYRWPSSYMLYDKGLGVGEAGDLLMGLTFGGFHLIYGLYVIFIENKRS
jgi:hypothetical protein